MTAPDEPEFDFDLPAAIGMAEAEIQTPCLILDLDALEANLRRMAEKARRLGLKLRAHAKMHKSVDVARLQHEIGGASGLCVQKVSEAEVFVRAGFRDILVTNQVRDPVKLRRLARMAQGGARIGLCLDDPAAAAETAAAASEAGVTLDAWLEVDVGARRCGVRTPEAAVATARAILAEPALRYAGVQAYHGPAQHIEDAQARAAALDAAHDALRAVLAALGAAGLSPPEVTGIGTGSCDIEGAARLHDEMQCGSYAFMDASYGRVRTSEGRRLDEAEWRPALFLLSSVISRAPGMAICDAGLKSQSVDSGMPSVHGRPELTVASCSDEHGQINDPQGALAINERIRLVPGHCDPTCNIHDFYVGLRDGVVEAIWPVSARGRML